MGKEVEQVFEMSCAKIEGKEDGAGWRRKEYLGKVPAKSGVYFFRDQSTQKVEEGYIGKAAKSSHWAGLQDRLRRHYYWRLEKGVIQDNLHKSLAEYLGLPTKF
jgi:hypothetical protein